MMIYSLVVCIENITYMLYIDPFTFSSFFLSSFCHRPYTVLSSYIMLLYFCHFLQLGFFTLSAMALVFFSHHICNAISRWSAINNEDRNSISKSKTNSAMNHSVRLFRCSMVISFAYLLRAGSWSWSSITNQNSGPYPW